MMDIWVYAVWVDRQGLVDHDIQFAHIMTEYQEFFDHFDQARHMMRQPSQGSITALPSHVPYENMKQFRIHECHTPLKKFPPFTHRNSTSQINLLT